MHKKTDTEFLIVGQGLAGTLTAFALMSRGRQVHVTDECREVTSSLVAAGMFSPVSGKRMSKSKDMDTLLPFAIATYQKIEAWLCVKVISLRDIYSIFGSVREQNDLYARMDDPGFAMHIDRHPMTLEHLQQPLGAFGIHGSGRVDTRTLITSFRNKLGEAGQFTQAIFDHASLEHRDGHWHWCNIRARHVIFCEGTRALLNPFFKELPLEPCKGEVLTIRCKELADYLRTLPGGRIIKKGIYLVHLNDDLFKVGATYAWTELSDEPTRQGSDFLVGKLNEMLDVPYTVERAEAAVRPSTRTREPFIRHHELPGLHMLNGLGTKGVLVGPWWAEKLVGEII